MKVEARVSESGQSVHAANDRDWAFVHPPPGRPRPILFCPERSCDNRVTAVEKPDATGQMTRFFRFVPRGATCTHAEVVNPVVSAQPNSAPPTGETAEHRWLKLYVRDVAERAGYQGVVVEQTLNDRVRADVF